MLLVKIRHELIIERLMQADGFNFILRVAAMVSNQ